MRVIICNIGIDNISMTETIDMIKNFIDHKKRTYIVTPNIDHIVKLQKDKEFLETYKSASLVVADGMPILWAAKFLGTPLKEKISGSDLFPKLCEMAAEKGYRLFFLGGRPEAALKASEVLKSKYSNIKIIGTYSPPLGFEKDKNEDDKIIKMIREAAPDILFVGLGAPKQEKWIYNHYKILNIPVSIGVGVVFEFMSGMVRRAPAWMQKMGFEWFWRLVMEPRRLWKRYLVDDVKFFWLVLKEKLKKVNISKIILAACFIISAVIINHC